MTYYRDVLGSNGDWLLISNAGKRRRNPVASVAGWPGFGPIVEADRRAKDTLLHPTRLNRAAPYIRRGFDRRRCGV